MNPKTRIVLITSAILLTVLIVAGSVYIVTRKSTPHAVLRLTFDNDLSGWAFDANYPLSADDGVLTVSANKRGALESFTYTSPEPLDIYANPSMNLRLRAEKDVMLSVSLRDASGITEAVNSVTPLEVVAAEGFHTLCVDFSGFKKVDLTQINTVLFVFNRSSAECDATVYIEEIALGIDGGAAPGMTAVTEQQAPINAPPQTVYLRGLSAAVPANMTLRVKDYDKKILQKPTIEYDGGGTASLTYTPQPDAYGRGYITLQLSAKGVSGATELTIPVVVDYNHPPTVNTVTDTYIVAGQVTPLVLTGLDDGNPYARLKVSIEAASTDPSLVKPVVRYAYGPDEPEHDPDGTYDRWATLLLETPADARGQTEITLTLRNDGGTAAGGTDTATYTFPVYIVASASDIPNPTWEIPEAEPTSTAITGFADDFSTPLSAWTASGEDCHTVSYEDGALRIDIDKSVTNNPWAGLWFQAWEVLDLSETPFLSVRMKTDKAPTEMLVFLWDADDRYNTAQTLTMKVTGEYTEYFFDFTDQTAVSDGGRIDLQRIKSLLINFAPGKMFTGTFWLQDFRVGDQVYTAGVPARLYFEAPEDMCLPVNTPEQTVAVTGIADGKGNRSAVTLSATCDNPALLTDLRVSSVSDGTAALRFTPAAGMSGQTTVTITASVPGADDYASTFVLEIAPDLSTEAVHVSVELSQTYQTVDGFGAFVGSGNPSPATEDLYVRYAVDIGMSVARIGVIDRAFEPANVNSRLEATDYSRYDTDALPLNLMKRLKEEAGVEQFILSMWSPPAWMKLNKSLTAIDGAIDNRLAPWHYEAYAAHLAAIVKTVKEQTGIDLYAVSLQNEPQFNEPYASAILLANEYVELVKVVGRRFKVENITTTICMPEALPEQKGLQGYIDALNNDSEAAQYVDIFAIHNYDGDGVHVGGAGTKDWMDLYEWTQAAPAKRLWMTETSGHPNNRSGAVLLAANIHNALFSGNAGGWLWWSFGATAASSEFGLLVDGAPTARYFASKQYYAFIRPGDVRVEAASDSAGVLSTAFRSPDGERVTVVLINGSGSPQSVRVAGEGLPSVFEVYETSPNRDFMRMPDSDGAVFLPPDCVVTLTFTS